MWSTTSKMRKAQLEIAHLPVPQFQDSVSLLLSSLEPLAFDLVEMETTKRLLNDFIKTQGPRAQELLERKAAECRVLVEEYRARERAEPGEVKPTLHPDGSPYPQVHFLEELWEHMAYLAWQDSISCYSNVFTSLFESTPFEKDVMLRAAWVVMGILDFGRQIVNGELSPEKGQCSAQYLKILFTTRLPGLQLDRVITKPVPLDSHVVENAAKGPWSDRLENTDAPHICVSTSNGHFYRVSIADASCEEMYECLKFIQVDVAKRANPKAKLAALTGGKRDDWYKARVRLMASSTTSAASLRLVEEAVFHVVLSELKPQGPAETMHALQEGRGVWLDKSTSIVVFANGCVGANLEHSAADAVVPSRMLVHANDFAVQCDPTVLGAARPVYKNAANTEVRKLAFGESFSGKKKPQKNSAAFLPFDFDEPTVQDVRVAEKHLNEIYRDNKVAMVTVTDVGTKDIKKYMAPDSFMQMALQLAYGMDQNGATPPTYETASTRQFLHGRTECIRSQSQSSRNFVNAYLGGKSGEAELKKLLLEGAAAHRNYLSKASNGRACDRHLLLLRVIAMKELGEQAHPLFADPLMNRGTGFQLSTSQLPWAVYDHPGFGAPFPDAYGCCYRFSDNQIVAGVACRELSCPTKNAQRFARNIEKAVHEVIRILEKGGEIPGFGKPAKPAAAKL